MSTRRLPVPVPVRWSDMDALGHVNNVQFLRLLEEARVRAVREWTDPSDGAAGNVVVARQEIEYLRQLRWSSEPIVVDCWVPRIGGASFDVGYLVRDERGTVYARAETTLVVMDASGERPARLGDGLRERLQAWHGDPPAMRRRAG